VTASLLALRLVVQILMPLLLPTAVLLVGEDEAYVTEALVEFM
jgi:hypothetical protein